MNQWLEHQRVDEQSVETERNEKEEEVVANRQRIKSFIACRRESLRSRMEEEERQRQQILDSVEAEAEEILNHRRDSTLLRFLKITSAVSY